MYEKRIKCQTVYTGKVIKVKVDDIELEKGNTKLISKREIVIHNGGVCGLVKTTDNKIKFVEQYRYAFSEVVVELPAGKIEKNETPDDTIIREIEEEVGLKPKNIINMGKLYVSPGFCTEIIHLYYIDQYDESITNFDVDENLKIVEYTYEESLSKIEDGTIVDAKTICLLLKCRKYFTN